MASFGWCLFWGVVDPGNWVCSRWRTHCFLWKQSCQGQSYIGWYLWVRVKQCLGLLNVIWLCLIYICICLLWFYHPMSYLVYYTSINLAFHSFVTFSSLMQRTITGLEFLQMWLTFWNLRLYFFHGMLLQLDLGFSGRGMFAHIGARVLGWKCKWSQEKNQCDGC